jgi:GMP synthase-like glutamine amidotransferase
LGSFENFFRSDGYAIETINAPVDPIPVTPEGYVGIIILGGPMSVYDNHAYLKQEQDLIGSAIKSGTPVLGICLGSQLIAQAAGGRVYRGRKKEIGLDQVTLTERGRKDFFKGIDDTKPMKVFQWHGDTYDLPESAVVLAKNLLYPQAFRIGSAIGVQFHLEVTEPMIRRWIREYRNELESEKLDPRRIVPDRNGLAMLASDCAVVYKNFSDELNSRKRPPASV